MKKSNKRRIQKYHLKNMQKEKEWEGGFADP